MAKDNIRKCPYCKEEIKAEATRCKHCRSNVPAEKPAHEGKCPYCKEAIHPEATKCKHCGSMLLTSAPCYGQDAITLPDSATSESVLSQPGQAGFPGTSIANNPYCGDCEYGATIDPFLRQSHGRRLCFKMERVELPGGVWMWMPRFWHEHDCPVKFWIHGASF